MKNDYIEQQKKICSKYKVIFFNTPTTLKIGISKNVKEGLQLINGLRHPPEGDSSGWYIWAGEELSKDPNFFVPLHISHLKDWCPQAIKYLGLPPGFRFLIAKDYEDVWEDKSLLDI